MNPRLISRLDPSSIEETLESLIMMYQLASFVDDFFIKTGERMNPIDLRPR